MNVLVLAESEQTYQLAALFARLGLPTVYYQQGSELSELDKNDVVHVASWRTHIPAAVLVVTDSPSLMLQYRSTKHPAPLLYIPRAVPKMQMPPEASDYLLALMMGTEVRKKRWWRFGRGK